MKKKTDAPKEIKGWTALTGVRGFCGACGALRMFDQTIYWRKVGDRTVLRCEGCASSERE